MMLRVPKGRGDLALWIPLAIWLSVTVFYIFCVSPCCHTMGACIPAKTTIFPLWILVFYGLIWSPINSYVSARMIGLTGSGVSFPYLKEVSIMKSGYQYVDIWYAPIPLNDYGAFAQKFREVELTGTKFTSIIKAEALMLPIISIASFDLLGVLLAHQSDTVVAASVCGEVLADPRDVPGDVQHHQQAAGRHRWVKEAINFNRVAADWWRVWDCTPFSGSSSCPCCSSTGLSAARAPSRTT